MLISTSNRERLTAANRPADCPASSAGMFVIRADGTATFDRHHHDVGEFWFIACGTGTVLVADTSYRVGPGDIVYTHAGLDHDIVEVDTELRIFWLTGQRPTGGTPAHLHHAGRAAATHPVATHRRPS